MYHKVCLVLPCVFGQIAQGLKFVSFLNNTYDPYFGTKESQYLIYFIQTQGFFTLLQFAYKAQPNARSHGQLRLRKA